MRTPSRIAAAVLALLCLPAVALADLVIAVADDAVLIEPAGEDGGEVVTWDWGVVVRPAQAPELLDLDETGFGIATGGGLRTFGPRDSDGRAPLTFISSGVVLTVDGDAGVETVDGRTVISAPERSIDPRAGLIMFLGLLILTGVMMRHTRRSMAAR
jgi:hypothetical protein